MFEVGNPRLATHELQPFGNSTMRITVKMAVMPAAKAFFICPERDEPDLLGPLERADYLHPKVTRSVIHEVGSIPECRFYFGDEPISDNEFAHTDESGGWRLD